MCPQKEIIPLYVQWDYGIKNPKFEDQVSNSYCNDRKFEDFREKSGKYQGI